MFMYKNQATTWKGMTQRICPAMAEQHTYTAALCHATTLEQTQICTLCDTEIKYHNRHSCFGDRFRGVV